MSQPIPAEPPPGDDDSLPPLPQPFDAEPKQLAPADGGGCGKVALIGCGVLVLIFGVLGAIFLVKADAILVWLLGMMKEQVETGFPEDLTSEDRARFDRAFEDLYAAIESEDLDPSALQALQAELLDVASKVENGLTRDEVLALTEAVERAAGRDPPEEAGAEQAAPDADETPPEP